MHPIIRPSILSHSMKSMFAFLVEQLKQKSKGTASALNPTRLRKIRRGNAAADIETPIDIKMAKL